MRILVIGGEETSRRHEFDTWRAQLGARVRAAAPGVLPGRRDVEEADLILADAADACAEDYRLLRRLRELGAAAPVVCLADQPPTIGQLSRVMPLGVKGWLPSGYSSDLTAAALRLVSLGGVHMPHRHPMQTEAPPPGAATAALSARQRQVLAAMGQGLTNQEIADALGISLGTTKAHIHAILRAMGARNRMEAVRMLDERERGL